MGECLYEIYKDIYMARLNKTLTHAQKSYEIAEHLMRTGHRPVIRDDVAEMLDLLIQCRDMVYISTALLKLLYRYISDEIERTKEPFRETQDPLNKPVTELTLRDMREIVNTTGAVIEDLYWYYENLRYYLLFHNGFVELLREYLKYRELLPLTVLALAALIDMLKEG